VVDGFADALATGYASRAAAKMGLPQHDKPLATRWLTLLAAAGADWTNAWRSLSSVTTAGVDAGANPPADLAAALARAPPVAGDRSAPVTWEAAGVPEGVRADAAAWLADYRAALVAAGAADAARSAAQDSVNPAVVPRNHLLQAAIDGASTGDLDELNALLGALAVPFEPPPPALARLRVPAPRAPRRGVELLSCSS